MHQVHLHLWTSKALAMIGLAECQSKTKSDNKEIEDIEFARHRDCIMHSESSPQALVLQC